MRLAFLKTVRVGVSLLAFLLTTFLFLDFNGTCSSALTNGVTFLQFVPSMLKFLSVASVAAAGFLFTVVLTLLFGRVYCSSICPLGTLQDIAAYVFRLFGGGKRYHFRHPASALRDTLLVITVLTSIGGTTVLLTVLDPFSNFGRIAGGLFRPVYLGANNVASLLLEQAGIRILYRVPNPMQGPEVLFFPVLIAIVLLLLVGIGGRLYCNSLCPLGTFLGLLGERSVVNVAIDKSTCKGCTLCERVCKGECIDRRARTIDLSRCVACFNCLSACPSDSITYGTILHASTALNARPASRARRKFIADSFVTLTGIALVADSGKRPLASRPTKVPAGSSAPVAPPGSISAGHFSERCTACQLCVSACPSHVLSPSLLDRGLSGIFQPKMDYSRGFCNYECVACSQICPSGAILPVSTEEKKLIQLGVAKFVKENCVVITDETECGACSEHCPTKAVTMVPYKHLVAPEVKSDYCVGCGACEYACPTKPFKAIYVEAGAVHAAAKKAEVKKLQLPSGSDEFPF